MLRVILLSSVLAVAGTTSAIAEKRCFLKPFNVKCIETAAENAWRDVTKGPGSNNDAIRHMSNASKDLTQGPGKNNDLVGKDGWLRKRLGF